MNHKTMLDLPGIVVKMTKGNRHQYYHVPPEGMSPWVIDKLPNSLILLPNSLVLAMNGMLKQAMTSIEPIPDRHVDGFDLSKMNSK